MSAPHALRWDTDGRDWPHRESSEFVQAAGLRWLVQQVGSGPVALLVHGTGASAHTWRDLMPLLGGSYRVVAMDLPGHGFTGGGDTAPLSLPGMARALAQLVRAMGLQVELVVGHSAGAAIGARMVLDNEVQPASLVAINGAFFPFSGWAGVVFPPMARAMAATPWAARWFARRTWDPAVVERLIGGTGSKLPPHGLALYGRLLRDPGHAAGALAMMAQWDLRPLQRDLARWTTPLALIVGAADRAVSPDESERLRRLIPASTPCTLDVLPRLGHLVHEEDAARVAELILGAARPSGRVAAA